MAGISRFLKNEVKNCAGKQSVTVVKSGASVTKIANYKLISRMTDYFVSCCIDHNNVNVKFNLNFALYAV